MYKSWSLVEANEANDKEITINSPRELENVHMWAWDTEVPPPTRLSSDNLQVDFHPGYSAGTSAVRGNTPFKPGFDYFWEIKMLSSIYGTDVMVGVGTARCKIDIAVDQFCSLLGLDKESWGLSYHGEIHHEGIREHYGTQFNKNDVVGVHFDTWNGILRFFVNGKPLGIAYDSINCQEDMYPMMCSTAAFSSMKLIYAFSTSSSLQNICLQTLSTKELNFISTIPGLSKLREQQLLDAKTFGREASLNAEYSTAENTSFIMDDGNEEVEKCVNVKNIYNIRQKRQRMKSKFDLNGIVNDLDNPNSRREPSQCPFSGITRNGSITKVDDGCKICGATKRPLDGVRQSLRSLTRRQAINSLCNNCSIIL